MAPRSGRTRASSRSRSSAAGSPASPWSTAASGPRSPPTSSSTPAACSRRRSAGWPASTSRSSRWPTNTSSPSRSRASIPGCRSSATRTISSTSARRSAGCAWAATSATRRRGRSTASRRTSTASCSRPTGRGSREIMDGAVRRVPAIADAGINRMINGPEAFTPDNEFILGESDVRGFFVAAGFCAHGIAGAGGIGRQMASWIVDGEPELDLWKMDIRRFGPAYRSRDLHARPDDRGLRDVLRHPLPERGASGRPAAPHCRRPMTSSPVSAPPSARSPAGSGRTGSSRTPPPGDEALRPRGWAGMHWSPAIGAEALATRTRRRPVRRDVVREDRGLGAWRRGLPGLDVRQRGRRPGRPDRLHPAAQPPRRHRVRPDGHARRGDALPPGHRDCRRPARPRLAPAAPARRRERRRSTTSRPVASATALWGPRARDILASVTRDDVSDAGFPYLTARADHGRVRAGATRCG